MELNAAARAAFDAMSEGITIIDTDGIIVFGNRAYRNFLNKEAGGDIGPIEGYRLLSGSSFESVGGGKLNIFDICPSSSVG